MKPEDVMKALECCANRSCEGCPLEQPNEDCVSGLPKAALTLLREKDAHIKRLEKAMRESISWHTELLENLNKLVEQKDAEIERLTKQRSISEEA